MKTLLLVLLLGLSAASGYSATISLASSMDGNSYLYESAYTGGYSRINLGNGSLGSAGANTGDRDGHYGVTSGYTPATDPTPTSLGSGWDLFPREANFLVGSLNYDESLVSLSGVSTVAITSINLTEFWKADPNRTSASVGNPPTVVSDISDQAIGLWLFGLGGGISFGDLDAGDTITFTDGVLTSIDLSITTTFSASALSWNGTFSISGDDIAYKIGTFGSSQFVADLNGTVNAVGIYNAVPEPSALALLALAGASLASRRPRKR